jgi:hypothetical protein
MEWLITSGIVSLLAGLFLLAGERFRRLGDLLNKPVAYIDSALGAARIPVGIVLVIAGGWVISVAFSYPVLWYLHVIGIAVLFFGLLYLFLPQWLAVFSQAADRILFTADEVVLGARKGVGVVLIVVAIYIFYVAYLMVK